MGVDMFYWIEVNEGILVEGDVAGEVGHGDIVADRLRIVINRMKSLQSATAS